ncbi:MAG: zinc-binding dehydrogenase [Bacteroidetes bacterium]|jgi:NADPH:quinone reductase-like Zn-dependent oxidoreductase|nr:zinc-binding dehydrogenase [Bacteroidota bacterium]
MKTILLNNYGLPNSLEIGNTAKPVPDENEVLVKIYAASINDWDCGLVRGKPLVIRLFFGLIKPTIRIPGVDISGKVEAVGGNVRSFSAGDEVYCDLSDCGFGGFAEYVSVPEQQLSKKPAGISHHEAAALPHAGLLALQGLLEKGKVASGQHILINGAGGGVGTLGIQLLKSYDVTVTGVDSGEKLGLMKSLGYDRVMDYKQTDFTETGETYDLILDTKSFRSVFAVARTLKPNGTYITAGGSMVRLLEIALFGWLISLFTGKKLSVLIHQPNKGLGQITELVEKGQVQPVVDGPYRFDRIPELIQYFGEGKHSGKVVVDFKK